MLPKCNYHHRIGSQEYFEVLSTTKNTRSFANVISKDFLGFNDLKPYRSVWRKHIQRPVSWSISVASGKIEGMAMVVACMDFNFIGGSLGSVMGEKISRAASYCLEHRIPFMIVSKSGGAG